MFLHDRQRLRRPAPHAPKVVIIVPPTDGPFCSAVTASTLHPAAVAPHNKHMVAIDHKVRFAQAHAAPRGSINLSDPRLPFGVRTVDGSFTDTHGTGSVSMKETFMFEITQEHRHRLTHGPSRGSTLVQRRSSTHPANDLRHWIAATLVVFVVVSFGGSSAEDALHAQTKPAPQGVLILGEIESITVSDMNNPASGGSISVAGTRVTIPDNLLIGLPGKRLTLRNLVLDGPDDCKAQVPPQSGLALSDSCRNDRAPGLARVVASPNPSGNLVAGVAMVQKDSGLTLGRTGPLRGSKEDPRRTGKYSAQPRGNRYGSAPPKPPK